MGQGKGYAEELALFYRFTEKPSCLTSCLEDIVFRERRFLAGAHGRFIVSELGALYNTMCLQCANISHLNVCSVKV